MHVDLQCSTELGYRRLGSRIQVLRRHGRQDDGQHNRDVPRQVGLRAPRAAWSLRPNHSLVSENLRA